MAANQDPHRQLPPTARPARRTPMFTASTTPAGLLADHHTTVWAELLVFAGSVDFCESETGWQQTATADQSVVIVPDRKHHISPSPDAEFCVQFFAE